MDADFKAESKRLARQWLADKRRDDPDFAYACNAYDLADECQNDTGINVNLDDLEDIFAELIDA